MRSARRAQTARRKFEGGWQLLSISTLTADMPFTVVLGSAADRSGSMGTDRPDQIGKPVLSTAAGSRRLLG